MPRETTSGGMAPAGSSADFSCSFVWTRTAAWSGSVPTMKRTMIIPPEGWVVE